MLISNPNQSSQPTAKKLKKPKRNQPLVITNSKHNATRFEFFQSLKLEQLGDKQAFEQHLNLALKLRGTDQNAGWERYGRHLCEED